MKRNKSFFYSIFALPYLLSQSIDELDRDTPICDRPLVGGQAVMGGVMMRNADMYGLAVRKPDNTIVASKHPWVSFFKHPLLRIPGIRGFPILIETLYNGISALNKSAELSVQETEHLAKWQLVMSLLIACVMAIALFVLTPHLLSFLMYWLNAGGDVERISFHIWDGFYKLCIFLGYIWLIAKLKEIRDVLCYHGAEHKTIHAYEESYMVTAEEAALKSRLHPRCGTTFLLFVISMSILLHAIIVPVILAYTPPTSEILKHIATVVLKILLIVPISALSYELIRKAAKLKSGRMAFFFQSPGLILQKLTTEEPDLGHLEVAVVALYTALENEERNSVHPVAFVLEDEQACAAKEP